MLIASFVVFSLLHLVPGDPAMAIAGRDARPERLAEIREELGLNRPLLEQYVRWLLSAMRLDLGKSLYSGEPVIDLVRRRLPPTLQLVGGSVFVSIVVGVPLGVFAAVRRRSVAGTVVSQGSTLGIAVPNFWLGMVLVFAVSLRLGWLPATGYQGITAGPIPAFRYSILPVLALTASGVAEVTRHVRAAMLEVIGSDFVRAAEARGLSRRRVIVHHALRNAAVPLVTVVGLLINRLLGATIVVETIFAIPGAGTMVLSAVTQRDYVVIQGITLVLVVIVIAVNSLVEVAYRALDPRIRLWD